jgi:hypothetical protein
MAFCELAVRLYTPNLNNLGAKSPIVSGLHLKYSRFLETREPETERDQHRVVWDAVLAQLFCGHSGMRRGDRRFLAAPNVPTMA